MSRSKSGDSLKLTVLRKTGELIALTYIHSNMAHYEVIYTSTPFGKLSYGQKQKLWPAITNPLPPSFAVSIAAEYLGETRAPQLSLEAVKDTLLMRNTTLSALFRATHKMINDFPTCGWDHLFKTINDTLTTK